MKTYVFQVRFSSVNVYEDIFPTLEAGFGTSGTLPPKVCLLEGKMIEDRSTANADPSGKTTYVFQDRAGKPGGGKGPLVSNGYYPTMTGHPFMICNDEVFAVEGNGCRPSHKGSGISEPNGCMYTLNTTEVHGVMYPTYGIDQQGGKGHAAYTENVMPTIMSDSHGTPHAVAYPCLMDQGGQIMHVINDQTGTIRAEMGGHAPIVLEESVWIDRHVNIGTDGLAPTLCAKYGTGGNNMPCVLDTKIYYNHPQASLVTAEKLDVCQTLTEKMGTGGGNVPLVREPMVYDSHPMDSRVTPCGKTCQTLSTRFGEEYSPNTILVREKEMEEMKYVVRRITPTECERLQGFPNKGQIGPGGKVLERDYTDIPWPKSKDGHSPDSHRYKALGNSMAVPVMRLIGESIQFALEHPITEDRSDKIAYQTSLFDF